MTQSPDFAGATAAPGIDTIVSLPRHTLAKDIATECRAEVLRFLNETRERGWSKLELALWITGPYERLTGTASRVARARTGEIPWSPLVALSLDEASIERMVRQAREDVLRVLEGLQDHESGAIFAVATLAQGVLVHCEDSTGGRGWLPLGRTHMTLTERLLALVAASYLKEPEAHENLRVCPTCGEVSFGPPCDLDAEHRGTISGILPRSRGGDPDPREAA